MGADTRTAPHPAKSTPCGDKDQSRPEWPPSWSGTEAPLRTPCLPPGDLPGALRSSLLPTFSSGPFLSGQRAAVPVPLSAPLFRLSPFLRAPFPSPQWPTPPLVKDPCTACPSPDTHVCRTSLSCQTCGSFPRNRAHGLSPELDGALQAQAQALGLSLSPAPSSRDLTFPGELHST